MTLTSLPRSPGSEVPRAGLSGPAAAGLAAAGGFVAADLTPYVGLVQCGSAVLGLGALASGITAVRASRRSELIQSVHRALAGLIGPPASTRIKARRWRRGFVGVPERLTVWFDPQARSSDPTWAPRLLEICRTRTGVRYELVRVDERRRRIVLRAVAGKTSGVIDAPEVLRATRIVEDLIGATATVTVKASETTPVGGIEVTHKNARLAASGYRARVERSVSALLPGRWRAHWDLVGDTVRFEPRPELPGSLWLPVRDLPPEVLQDYRRLVIPLGVDEDGHEASWQPSQVPHMLVSGGTGTGKTQLDYSVLGYLTRAGLPVWILDGKGSEFVDFQDWPGVQVVANTVEEQVAMIHQLVQLMRHRYHLIRTKQARLADFEPLFVFLDEWTDFVAELFDWYVEVKGKNGPAKPPTIREEGSLARKARQSAIHMIKSLQRPDVALLGGHGGEVRSNFGMRVSMGRLDQQGAMMMWGNPVTGTTTPRATPGRAVAVGHAGDPVEIQCYRFPALDAHPDSEEGELLAALRPAASLHDRHERYVVVPPEEELDHETAATFTHYQRAMWVPASSRPDLDPVAQYALVDALRGRELASVSTVLGQRPAPVVAGADAGRVEDPPLEQERPADPFELYLDEEDVPASQDEIEIGDLVQLPDTDQWVTVESEVGEDLLDSEAVSIFWCDDEGESGCLAVTAGDLITVRRLPRVEDES
ncbi:MAG: hypothetical protein L0H26_06050 [Microlunatus sp.]|nr:hypothetical protein [Microlunatus sp.]